MKTISSRFYFRAKNAIQCLKSDYYLLLKKLLKCLKICIHHIRDRFSLRILLLQLVQKSDFHVPGVENQVYVAGQTDKRAIPDNPGSHHRPHIAYELFGAGHPYSGIPRSFQFTLLVCITLNRNASKNSVTSRSSSNFSIYSCRSGNDMFLPTISPTFFSETSRTRP